MKYIPFAFTTSLSGMFYFARYFLADDKTA